MGVLPLFGGSRRSRAVVNAASLAAALLLAGFAAQHFARVGWPLAGADLRLVASASVLFLFAYALKAHGWQRLFVPDERPHPLALAAASGAASVTGAALPGRLDDAVRVAILRRHPSCRAGVGTLCLSLFLLGLIDTVALTPLAFTAAAASDVPLAVRIGLAVVALAGLGAAALVCALPRLAARRRLTRFRAGRWVGDRAPSLRDAWKAALLVLASWLVRVGGLVLLLAAIGVGLSLPLVLTFLCAAAASGAHPVAPAGAATQAGAGAAVLVASGISTTKAVAFAVAAQGLLIVAGAAVVVFALAWSGGRRVALRAAG